ncbi:MAG: hypothetical protein Ct9H300mP18_03550 [Candidatus Neomarinimicrobiota bacterium]|nr:MAG: hypothetical protein Ct9H300mP18_03550 [Candidatus Neomarinimicrobiota bacterium]
MNSVNLDDETWIKNWNTIMNINLLAAGVLSKKPLEHFKTKMVDVLLTLLLVLHLGEILQII